MIFKIGLLDLNGPEGRLISFCAFHPSLDKNFPWMRESVPIKFVLLPIFIAISFVIPSQSLEEVLHSLSYKEKDT